MTTHLKSETMITHFISSIKKRLLGDKFYYITVNDITDKQSYVYINHCFVGAVIIEHCDSIFFRKFPEDTIFYFLPTIAFFDFADLDSINDFITIIQRVTDTFRDTMRPNDTCQAKGIQLEDIGFSVDGKEQSYEVLFDNHSFYIKENMRAFFRFVKKDNEFILIDDFNLSLYHKNLIDFDLLGLSHLNARNYYGFLNIRVSKEADVYCISNKFKEYYPSV